MKPLRMLAGSIAVAALLVSSGRAERVGLTQTWVDDTKPLPYRIEGGSDEFHATGEICSLMRVFVVKGGGVTVRFSPQSTLRGRYTYSRKVEGADVERRGVYEVQYDGRFAIGIVASDSSAPEGTVIFRLKPLPGACST